MVAFIYGPHAADMLIDRDIDRASIERTVLAPDSREPDPKRPARTRVFHAIPRARRESAARGK